MLWLFLIDTTAVLVLIEEYAECVYTRMFLVYWEKSVYLHPNWSVWLLASWG